MTSTARIALMVVLTPIALSLLAFLGIQLPMVVLGALGVSEASWVTLAVATAGGLLTLVAGFFLLRALWRRLPVPDAA